MRRAGFTLVAVLVVSAAVFAQVPQPPGGVQPPMGQVPLNLPPLPGTAPAGGAVIPTPGAVAPQPAVPQVDPALLQHLQNWEQVMKGAANFYAECGLTRENKLRKTKADFKGSIMCLKPGKARMRIEAIPAPGAKPDPNDFISYICTPQAVYEYDGSAARLTEVRFPNGASNRNLLLDFMSGSITAKAALDRFSMKILKQDQFYVYIEIKPLTAQDRADFESMILVLFLNTPGQPAYLPRQVVIRKPNGQEEENWDFPRPAINAKGILVEYFEPEKPFPGWKHEIQNAPADNQPRPVATPVSGSGLPPRPPMK